MSASGASKSTTDHSRESTNAKRDNAALNIDDGENQGAAEAEEGNIEQDGA